MAAPVGVAEFFRSTGKITEEQLVRLLSSSSPGDDGARRAKVVLALLDPLGTGVVDAEAFLAWLYSPNAEEGQIKERTGDESPCLPQSRHSAEDVLKMGELLEVQSKSQEAMMEFRAMAEKLAEDFLARDKSPQAEAFIEQLCVERILEGCLFVGHAKTDLDSIAGAIGAAHLWRGVATRAERELNGEIQYALNYAGIPKPPFFDDVPGAAEPDESGNLLKICLVDHNEEKQMTESLRKDPNRMKRIVGLIDHHALSETFASEKPVFMDLRPWGSMSTIVAHAFIRSNRPMPKHIARILLAAILSDTLNLQSVTATNADRMMVTLLAILGEVEDPDQLARAMFRAKTEWIVNLGAYEMTRGDQKDFAAGGWKFGIAVLEVTDPAPVLDAAQDLLLELRILKAEKGKLRDGSHDRRKELDFAFVFVVDVTQQQSVLLICGSRELALAKAGFPGRPLRMAKPGIQVAGMHILPEETLMDVGPLVSRKAQFAPAFFETLSAGFTCHRQPMSSLDEDAALKALDDEVAAAVNKMEKDSYHDSVHVVRDYTKLCMAMARATPEPAMGG